MSYIEIRRAFVRARTRTARRRRVSRAAFLVEVPGDGVEEFEWEDLDDIVFGPAPETASPESRRLYGVVEDHKGRRFTGYIAWDLDEILADDVLDGEDEDNDG